VHRRISETETKRSRRLKKKTNEMTSRQDAITPGALFERADLDHNGALDRSEVTKLLVKLFDAVGWTGLHASLLQSMITFMMDKAQDDDKVSMPEFVNALANPKWKKVLPPGVWDQVQAAVESFRVSREEDKSTCAMVQARSLFDVADVGKEGRVGTAGLTLLIGQHVDKGGTYTVPEFVTDRDDWILDSAEGIIDANGRQGLHFGRFCRCLSEEPLKQLLPAVSREEMVILADVLGTPRVPQ